MEIKSRANNWKRSELLSAGDWGLAVETAGARHCYFFITNNLLKFNFKDFVYILRIITNQVLKKAIEE